MEQQSQSRPNQGIPSPSSLPSAEHMPNSPLANGLARTTPRKRKPSGSGTARSAIDPNDDTTDYSYPPAAPEVPTAPPLSYRSSAVNAVGRSDGSSANPFTGSFAQRAALLTGRSIPSKPANDDFDPIEVSEPTKPGRRTSLNRPIGGLYNEIQQHRRDSYPASAKTATSPNVLSFPSSPRNSKIQDPAARPSREASSGVVPLYDNLPPSRSNDYSPNPVRSSRRESQDQWASDRSPLQRLEAKMSDMSKSEKRARVEMAEQRLRASQAAAQSTSPKVPDSAQGQSPRTLPSQGLTRSPVGRNTVQAPERASSNRPALQSRTPDRTSSSARSSNKVSTPDTRNERGVRFNDHDTSNNDIADKRQLDRGLSPISTPSPNSPQAIAPDKRVSDRSTRSSAKNVPPEQQKLYGNRMQRGPAHHSPESARGLQGSSQAQDPSNSSKPSAKAGAPQTAAGVSARQRVGFDNDVLQPAAITKEHRHHLQHLMHRSKPPHDQSQPPESKPKRLDEWRQGEVARLMAEDFEDKPVEKNPWWEKSASNSRRRSQRGSGRTDDPYEDGSGKFESSFPSDRRAAEITHVEATSPRQYVVDSDASERKKVLWHIHDGLSSIRPSSKRSESADLPLTYSYSCPSLAEHNALHADHICEPYVSKELTMSMRSIRIRPVPTVTRFSPPLYLKCGPLLRYTGMKRDRLQRSGRAGPQSSERETWRGSVMIVTTDASSNYETAPTLRLYPEPMEKMPPPQEQKMEGENADELPPHFMDPVAGLPKLSRTGKTIYVKPVDDLEPGKDHSRFEANDDGLFEDFRSAAVPTAYGTPEYRPGQNGNPSRNTRPKTKPKIGQKIRGVRLRAERGVTFWRFNLEVELQSQETRIAYSINNGPATGFWIPGRGQTMNTMFHSCNGFSLSVNPDDFSGPDPLWRDVLNSHQTRPFHVMIGGGDQIYNDAVMKQSPLFGDWLDIKNPHHKHEAEFTPELLEELETFYLERYSMWFSQGLFGMANAQIPMVNIWDDHDIIDGFGSYPDHFMSTPAFCGLGAVAYKYYMLFQHQSVPSETSADEPSWLLGAAPGPYITELSRSVYVSLGKSVAFLGLDCRTERTREEVLTEPSYDIIFDRCRREIVEGETKHLIVLLGVPIAYPRLVWLENLLTSRALDPIRALGKTGMLGGFLNKFDGGVEILDDLDDHWTAKNHKQERNWFVQELQELAADKSVRVTILGGDVHLAAVGQFYSNPKLKIPKDRDHRYMPNIISSAIVNTPPPEVMSDILNKRNKTHHLDSETHENMIPMFSHDVDGKARNNKRLLPRRNWCSIQEYHPGSTPPPTPPESLPATPSDESPPSAPGRLQRTLSLTRDDIRPGKLLRRLSGRERQATYLDAREDGTPSPPQSPPDEGYFSRHPSMNRSTTAPVAASDVQRNSSAPLARPGNFLRRPTNMSERAAIKGDPEDTSGHVNLEHGLDIVLNCEIDQKNPAGVTTPYRLLVPALRYDGEGDENAVSYRAPKFLQRLSSLRGRKVATDTRAQAEGDSENDSFTGSDLSEEESQQRQPRPRRWSFGLERRRKYRDQTPPQERAPQISRPLPQQDPTNEAQRLGDFSDRPRRREAPPLAPQLSDDRSGMGRPQDGFQNGRGPAHARRNQAAETSEDYDSEEEPSSKTRSDSIDYHANLATGQADGASGYNGKRTSKIDRMLGVEKEGTLRRGTLAQPSDDEDNINGELRPASKRYSGYNGVEDYPEQPKKGWRNSLRRFSGQI